MQRGLVGWRARDHRIRVVRDRESGEVGLCLDKKQASPQPGGQGYEAGGGGFDARGGQARAALRIAQLGLSLRRNALADATIGTLIWSLRLRKSLGFECKDLRFNASFVDNKRLFLKVKDLG